MSQTCPRCRRPLPPGSTKVCVYCGIPLAAAPTRPPTPGLPTRLQRDPLIGQTVAGRFKVEELIGQGGMGKVYRARHLSLDRLICLKMLKPALLEDPTLVGRFEREAKAASRLNHPNVIQVLDFGRNDADGSLFIAMEYVQGKDLRIVLRDEWPVDEDRLCGIMAQACAALGEAHARHVIHRDLKPENIMVEQRRDHPDFVKVLDFGIAKILDSDMPGLTRNDVVCGTPQYMAPEQATGGTLDARCDLYAIGVILYQMVTGHLPFDGQSSMEVLTRHVNEQPMPPRQRQPDAPISEAMEAVILRAMEKEPARRPQSAKEFRELLLDVVRRRPARNRPAPQSSLENEGLAPGESDSEADETPAPPRRKWLRPALLSGAAVSVAAVAAVAFLRPPAAGIQPIELSGPAGGQGQKPRDPEKARDLVQRAAEWQAANDTGTARDLLERAIELDPANAEAHFRLGGLFLNSQPERARSEYLAAKRLDADRYADFVDATLKGLSSKEGTGPLR